MKKIHLNHIAVVVSLIILSACAHRAVLIEKNDTESVDKLRLVYDKNEDLATQVGVTVTDAGDKIAMAYDNGRIQILDLRTGKIIKTVTGNYDNLFDVRFNREGDKLLTFDTVGDITLYDLKDGKKYNTSIEGKISSVKVGPENYLAVGNYEAQNPSLYIFKIDNGIERKGVFGINNNFVSSMAFNKEGSYLVAVAGRANQGQLYLLDLKRMISSKQEGVKMPRFIGGLRYYEDRDLFILGGFHGRSNYFFQLVIQNGMVHEISRTEVPFTGGVKGSTGFVIWLNNFYHLDDKTCVVNYDNAFLCFDLGYQRITFTTLKTRKHKSGDFYKNIVPRKIYPLYDGKSYLVNYDIMNKNINQIFDAGENKFTSYIYSDGNGELAIVARDGRMEGTSGAISNVYWSQHNTDKRIPLEATFDEYYTPNLLQSLFSGQDKSRDIVSLERTIELAPLIEILQPDSMFTSDKDQLTVILKGIPQGDPIKEFKVFVNGRPLSGNQRGFKIANGGNTQTFTVPLLPGRSTISAVAVSEGGYQSAPDQIVADYQGPTATSNLHILAVGIDRYKNSSYNLNYATADASGLVEEVQSKARDIFGEIKVTYIRNEEVTKENIQQAVQIIQSQARLQDVFLFYYAGHGVMSEGTEMIPSDFYLALHDVTQLYGRDEMLREKGVSAAELRDIFSSISAQKQLIILDACQSGGAVETFAMRGAAEEKAMIQLARSSGVVLLASTGSEQFATEFAELGHGVFTYSILQGLGGMADSGDGKVTVKELEAFLNDAVPELTEQYKGMAQYPRSWSRGMDFPIGVLK